MSNEEINKYKELYSQLVSELTGLHNTNLLFLKYIGRDTGLATRKHLRAIADIATAMKKQGQLVCKESMANKRANQKKQKEERRAAKKVMPRKPKKDKTNGYNKPT